MESVISLGWQEEELDLLKGGEALQIFEKNFKLLAKIDEMDSGAVKSPPNPAPEDFLRFFRRFLNSYILLFPARKPTWAFKLTVRSQSTVEKVV